MFLLPLQRCDLFLCRCDPFSQNELPFLYGLAYFIDLDLLCVGVTLGCLFPELGGHVLVEALAASETVHELVVFASADEGVRVEALLLEDLADFLDGEHWVGLLMGVFLYFIFSK